MGARKDDMSNICELPINAVSDVSQMMLTGFDQKVRGMDRALRFRSAQSANPPANRQALSHPVKLAEHGKPDYSQTMWKANRKASRRVSRQRMLDKANAVQ